MFNPQRLKPLLLCLKGILRTSPTSRCFRLLQHYPSLTFSLKYRTSASPDERLFTVSYLINRLGFSQEAALDASKKVRFDTSRKPDSVVIFFESHGFTKSMIKDVIRRDPWLLVCDPQNNILPKFEFFLSKGATTSDLNSMVLRTPRFLMRSLENHIIPSYEMLTGFLQNDKTTISCIKGYPDVLYDTRVIQCINLLLNNGVSRTNVALILRRRPRVLHCPDLLTKAIEEVKCLGFNPLNIAFSVALVAKTTLSRSRWEAKVDVYKRWGWSEEEWSEAFRKQPHCMLASEDKIDAVMSFWSNHLGWNPLLLVKRPHMFGYSLKRRIIPRASVLHYLKSKGLIKKDANLVTPFTISEEQFLERFVKHFDEHNHHLSKLYRENLKNDGIHFHEILKF
ncbi:transcription termination factor MTERF15, mitochondrial [Neltuma alba]|uniref:transcription termination factor MTERF15, mitochondrial n=1 Tax=Neltuma alba TaxID=207710 RepID=UPI0010A3FED9|nr:transcription termination factor MTERF15, mitochondrial-like [Prosopis alba]